MLTTRITQIKETTKMMTNNINTVPCLNNDFATVNTQGVGRDITTWDITTWDITTWPA